MALFDVQNVSFAYPGHAQSLNGLNFRIERGERLALLGANGSGKSTLLHLLNGLYFASEGAVSVWGSPLTEEALLAPEFARRFRSEVAFLFQNSDAQLFCATVEEELAFGPLQMRLPKSEIRSRIDETLALLNISVLRDRAPQTLSAGQKKMVALASVLIMSPSVLLLDEPTAGLDPRSQERLLEILDELAGRGITLITATHDLPITPQLADRAVILDETHRIVYDGPLASALEDIELLVSANLLNRRTLPARIPAR